MNVLLLIAIFFEDDIISIVDKFGNKVLDATLFPNICAFGFNATKIQLILTNSSTGDSGSSGGSNRKNHVLLQNTAFCSC